MILCVIAPFFVFGQNMPKEDSPNIFSSLNSIDSIVKSPHRNLGLKPDRDLVDFFGVIGTIIGAFAIIFSWIEKLRNKKKITDLQEMNQRIGEQVKVMEKNLEVATKAQDTQKRLAMISVKPELKVDSSTENRHVKLTIKNWGQPAFLVGIKELGREVDWTAIPPKHLLMKGEMLELFGMIDLAEDATNFQTDTWIYYQDELLNKFVLNFCIIDGAIIDRPIVYDELNIEESNEFIWKR